MGEKDMEINVVSTPNPNTSPPTVTMSDTSPFPEVGPPITPKPKSFKDALVVPKTNYFYFDEEVDTITPDVEVEERDPNMEGPHGIPKIFLPKQLLQQIRQPWNNSLILRLLGKSIGYQMLCTKVRNQWTLQDEFNAIDLGNNYFFFKFSSHKDCAHVYSGGPVDHRKELRRYKAPNPQPQVLLTPSSTPAGDGLSIKVPPQSEQSQANSNLQQSKAGANNFGP
ncbi:hypothetical protein LOK49_LG14G00767 [Camellia lanceoleosa]|uniref:Uncharacterized protein n=1 Tax=Camellia lanceoleosa TaxID=1840588 RepID=A0ACC0FAG9_9ERIC|nr:hypothetical protein LOK49_LG14G00767 [Camellia lanceoleosa]